MVSFPTPVPGGHRPRRLPSKPSSGTVRSVSSHDRLHHLSRDLGLQPHTGATAPTPDIPDSPRSCQRRTVSWCEPSALGRHPALAIRRPTLTYKRGNR